MKRFLFLIDAINTWVGKAFSWLIVSLTVTVAYSVVARYVFRAPVDWSVDWSYIFYGTFFMMGGAYTLARNGHVRGDMIYHSLPVKTQAILDLILYFLFFLPGVTALVVSGFRYAADSWSIMEQSSATTAATPIYLFKSFIPLAGVLLLLQGIAEIIRCIQAIKTGVWPDRLADVEETQVKVSEERDR
ncbi:MAG: TRAP transporter small permease subunit [Prochloraceae cyanobacterium]